MTATQNSDGLKGMGQDSPIDGAAAIAAAYVIQDLMSDPLKPLDKVVIASLAQKWLMDRLINNTVNVAMGSQSEQFVLLADGSFNPRLGSSNRLASEGGAYTLTAKDGTALDFDTKGNIATWRNTSGPTVSFAYDASTPPRLTRVTNGVGRSLALGYNGSGQLTSVTDNASPPRRVTYGYDGNGNLTSATDPLGQTTTYSYASIGEQPPSLLFQILYPANPLSAAVTNNYDSLGRIATQTNANGAVWTYYFAGYRSEEDDPYGTQHVLYYNARGLPQFEIQDYAGQGLTTSWLYDGLGRLVQTTLPEGGQTRGGVTTATWDAGRQLLTATSPGTPAAPSGLVTASTYDPNGQLLQVRRSANGAALTTASATYTLTGRTATATDARGNVTRYAYDLLDRLASVTDPMSRSTRFTYTVLGQPYRTYNTAIQAAPLLEQAWRPDGVPASIKDANGNTTSFAYERFNRLSRISYPGGSTDAATYDANGRLQRRTLRHGFSKSLRGFGRQNGARSRRTALDRQLWRRPEPCKQAEPCGRASTFAGKFRIGYHFQR